MEKYPIVIPYIKDGVGGLELKSALRSVKNIQNFDGRVFVVGDREVWFSHQITHIRAGRSTQSPYKDVELKFLAIYKDDRVPEDYIYMADDVYTMRKTHVRPLHGGVLEPSGVGYHNRAKKRTRDFLVAQGIKEPLNYSLHVPMIMNKEKRMEVHKLIRNSLDGVALLASSVYGNIHKVGGEYYEDKKTKTADLKDGEFISTQYYTNQLQRLFPEPSKYENDGMQLMDVVIPYKSTNTDEIKYAIRSLVNIRHRNVYVIGDDPKLKVKYIPFKQGRSIGKNTFDILNIACKNKEITDNFIWMHDDMIIQKPVKNIPLLYKAPFSELINFFDTSNRDNYYTKRAKRTYKKLLSMGIQNPLSYELHIPFVINKQKWNAVSSKIGTSHNKLSMYANIYNLGGERSRDVKVRNRNWVPNGEFISTHDGSFYSNRVGEVIRNKFAEPSKYE